MKQDSFKAGLTLGVCLGVAGYFLFGTEKGKKVRTELEQAWQDHPDIQEKLPATLRDSSFAETMQEIMVEVSAALDHLSQAADESETKAKIAPRKRRKPKKTFTGV